jgi:SH3 domain protein
MLTRILFTLMLCFPLALPAAARKSYITDKLEVQMRSGQSLQHKIVKMVPSGTPLTILDQNADSGYSLVRLDSGEEGWVLTRYLSAEPITRSLLDDTNAKLTAALEENLKLKEELSALKSGKEGVDKTAEQQRAEIERLNTELIAIRQASANALQIQADRDQLRESVINLGRELETTRREKNALDSDYRQDWFLIGAGVLFGGILLGVLLPKLTWRKKSTWGSF